MSITAKSYKFGARLRRMIALGRLNPSELAFWLGRPRPTIYSWMKGSREPSWVYASEVEERLKTLEALVKSKGGLPLIDYRLSLTERRRALLGLFDVHYIRNRRVLKTRSSNSRLVRPVDLRLEKARME